MRGQEFRARDKKVQKMTRDGLTEKNLTAGTEQRISGRAAEVSFGRGKTEEMAAGHRAGSRLQKGREKKEGGKARDFVPQFPGSPSYMEDNGSREMPAVYNAELLGTEEKDKMSASMRDAGDKPLLSKEGMFETTKAWKGLAGKRRRPRRRKKRTKGLYQEENRGLEPEEAKEDENAREQKGEQEGKRQEKRRGEDQEKGQKQGQDTRKGQKHFKEVPRKKKSPRLRYGRGEAVQEETRQKVMQEVAQKFTQEESHADGGEEDKKNLLRKQRREKRYLKAQKRVEAAGRQVEKARAGLPTRRRLYLERYYGEHYGKFRCRLRFEDETIKEEGRRQVFEGAGKSAGHLLTAKAHQKIREAEKENVGVEAGHKAESAAELGMAHSLSRAGRKLRTSPYRRLERAKGRLKREEINLAYRKLSAGQPELEKKALARRLQKRKIKRRYIQAAKAAEGVWQGTKREALGGAARALAKQAVAKKTVFLVAATGILFLSFFGSLFSSCSAMLQGAGAAVVAACYVADDKEINESELKYTELETGLKEEIGNTEEDFPDYDEYLYNIGEIGHNPYELMGYLSAAFDAFTFPEVEAEILRLFGLQYELTRQEVTEVRVITDGEGEEQEVEWRVLKTRLDVRPLSEIIAESLGTGDEWDRYGVYMETCGGRQCYGNPFDFPWVCYVTSPYGYRLHPISGERDLHRGIDIGAAEGTPVKAVQDGVVLSAGEAGDYGLCVVIEGEEGYQSRYAHCSALLVGAGQEVKRGDVVAYVGSTGNSTGSHLHLEVVHEGEYLNPYYFVDNGGLGYTAGGGAAAGPAAFGDPGEAMGEGQFAALLAEAEKYLGFPYVWGGSSPETSFDCSGYVSYVINHSGVGNVGRQTAQGLYDLSEPVPREELSPGDLVFFTGTYSTASPVSHVGIYVGNGRMVHAGDPVSYADITTEYWLSHYFCGGRLP